MLYQQGDITRSILELDELELTLRGYAEVRGSVDLITKKHHCAHVVSSCVGTFRAARQAFKYSACALCKWQASTMHLQVETHACLMSSAFFSAGTRSSCCDAVLGEATSCAAS